jgi:hypothetical protein
VLQLNFLHCFLAGKKILPRNRPKKSQDTKHRLASHGLRDTERERGRVRERRNWRAEATTNERRCAPETQEEGKHALTSSETFLGLGLGLPARFLLDIRQDVI